MPIDPSTPIYSALAGSATGPGIYPKENSRSSFILLSDGKGYDAYIMTVLADPSYLKNDQSKLAKNTYRKYDADFTGFVFYFTPKGLYSGGYEFKNGQLLTAAAQNTPSNGKTIQSTGASNLKIAVAEPPSYDCTFYYMLTVDQYGNVIDQTFLYAECTPNPGTDPGSPGAGSPGGSPPVPPKCNPPTAPSGDASVQSLIINVTEPPPGGDGGMPPPTTVPCNVTVPETVDTPAKTPCAGVAQLNAVAINDSIAKQNNLLAGYLNTSTLEHGFDQNLQNWNSGINSMYLSAPLLIAAPATPDQLNPPFTWNSTNGYTIGFAHNHPNGSGPSPEDIFYMLLSSKNSALTAAGSQAISFYKANASVTVVTSTNNYVVTISNWTTLQTLYNTYISNPTAFDNNVINNTSKFQSYEAAILTAFSGAINLYTNGGLTQYYPLTVNSTTHAVSEVPCPTN